ncbi:ribose-phosphate diphosphokinase [Convivina praedatoris]|uniref:ribose-phosphate diphosphokinase n=1 Tax=Convivina praedatoris TaxID=2880963 RepID=A0ABM9D366_9LACO|nr:ribose-phosphate pyrophosphokinase [Convivina sp. LMG 32447]CAH1853401.1 Ribose-phosphate pyrophosphokinase [Convivina sp. LMG 32447]CAH1854776.1 Ribose-phosphate pyrophosphokinase [Convivina sp. LMG 32447]CAH1855027.1 Ribose-phosphate pyrophosphokinase [Convivina sp. LMG 32447]
MTSNPEYRLFDLGSNPTLAAEIAEKLDLPLAKVQLEMFADNEIYERIEDSVRGMDVYVIQSISDPVNDNFIKLMIFIDAVRRTSAKSINVIMPYFGYARSDRKARSREPIVARLIADMLESQGVKRMLTMDLHTGQVQGFFDIPVDHLLAMPVQTHYFYERGLIGDDVVVVASNPSSLKMVQRFAKILGAQWALVDRRQDEDDQRTKPYQITGNVAGKVALILDDMIDTGRSMVLASEAIQAAGAHHIEAVATHAVLSGSAVGLLENSPIQRVVVTNTIEVPDNKRFSKLVDLSVAETFAAGLKRVIAHESIAPVLLSPDNPEV